MTERELRILRNAISGIDIHQVHEMYVRLEHTLGDGKVPTKERLMELIFDNAARAIEIKSCAESGGIRAVYIDDGEGEPYVSIAYNRELPVYDDYFSDF